ncbi:hypothetical protein [Kitasatospora purpeofusca]|uniref:Uncharacterized protein n=1 Tax=Kitasatospora purpeofusca TaxID=67352 RepID=A0ABZ1TT88_9ACTN|nr:hypothetical protein [Kitasatospora purpeofusca]
MAKLLDPLLPVIDGIIHRLHPRSDHGSFGHTGPQRRPAGHWASRYWTWRSSRPSELRRPAATRMQPGDLPPDLQQPTS